MTLAHLIGQDEARDMLSRALGAGRVHHAYRFEGPRGVGKELAAFGLAQALLCTGGAPLGCGTCSACTRVAEVSERSPHVPLHPDVIVVEQGLYSEAILGVEERSGITLRQIRRIVLPHVAFAPAEGRARVFIIRRADELRLEAANALLKTLEEPRAGSHFILLTNRPDKLLPTIRSRSLLVRFGPLPSATLRRILVERGRAKAELSDALLDAAEGSVEKAEELAEVERAESLATFLRDVTAAASAGTAGACVRLGETAPADRRVARDRLYDLAAHLAGLARRTKDDDVAAALAHGYADVMTATEDLEMANAMPAHVLTSLALRLHRAGVGRALRGS